MSNVKISELPTGAIAGTDTVPVVKAGVTTAVPFSHTHPQSDITSLTTDLATIRTRIDGLALTTLDTSAWSWVNQGSTVLTDSNGTTFLTFPSTAGTNHRGKYTAVPASTPYNITVKVSPFTIVNDFLTYGIAFRESASGKVTIFGFSSNSGFKVGATKITTNTTFVSDTLSAGTVATVTDIYLRIGNNGTNVVYSYSLDGSTFITHLSEAKATYFTTAPDQWGIAGNNNGLVSQIMLFRGFVIS